MDARKRTLHSLDGLSVGDAYGEHFVWHGGISPGAPLPPPPWRWTDDTHMALSIVEVLLTRGEIDGDALAAAFARRFAEEPWRGYAAGAAKLLSAYARGGDWRELAPAIFEGGSYGNGGAMRAAPIGAFFAGDPDRAAREAARSACVTHAHPEGQAGAIAVAVAASLRAADVELAGVEFLDTVLRHMPDSPRDGTRTRQGIARARTIAAGDVDAAAHALGTGYHVAAFDTVPFCLWIVAHEGADYARALEQTVRGRGDADTTSAIVGGIIAADGRPLPPNLLEAREPLPPL